MLQTVCCIEPRNAATYDDRIGIGGKGIGPVNALLHGGNTALSCALRQFNFCSILIGAAPNVADYKGGTDADRAEFANRSGKLVALAGESFNDGLRGYYFAIAAMTWFVQPTVFMIATTVVVAVLYFREFRSSALHAIIGR